MDYFEDSLAKNYANETGRDSNRCTYIFGTVQYPAPTVDRSTVAQVTIDMLPDLALLEIFDFYVKKCQWYTLVHVCRKWRSLVFGSPRRLNLQLVCKPGTPVREKLDIWPPLPIVVCSFDHKVHGVDNLAAALERNDRIYDIILHDLSSSQFERVFAAMQQPFPALTNLILGFRCGSAPVDLASFLGGTVPRLKSLSLIRNSSPGLLKPLLSATDLVSLQLLQTSHSGYIPPEALTTYLSVLIRLECLEIEISFESSSTHPRHLPPPTHLHLPVLTMLKFIGVAEYLENLIARIHAPLLDNLQITLLHQMIFHTPQLTQFVGRTPKFKTHDTAHLIFSNFDASVKVFDERLRLNILCNQPDWWLPSLMQICSAFFPRAVIAAVEHLFILENPFVPPPPLSWQNDIESSQWLKLFHPFTAVKHLFISSELTPRIAPTLKDLVEERVAEVLPDLQNIFLEETHLSGPVQEAIGQFISARQLAGHPVAISLWERKRLDIWRSFTCP